MRDVFLACGQASEAITIFLDQGSAPWDGTSDTETEGTSVGDSSPFGA